MGQIIAVSNQKGGVGKTTLCYHLALHLSLLKKKKVLVVDLDGQGNLSRTLLTERVDKTTLAREMLEVHGLNTCTLFVNPDPQLPIIKATHGIDLIYVDDENSASVFSLNGAGLNPLTQEQDDYLTTCDQIAWQNLQRYLDDYDYILLDCPPQLGNALVFAFNVCDYIVVPLRLVSHSTQGANDLINTLYNLNRLDKFLGFILNNVPLKTSYSRTYENRFRKRPVRDAEGNWHLINDARYFTQTIHVRPSIDNSQDFNIPVWKMPGGKVASAELSAVFEELLKRIEGNFNYQLGETERDIQNSLAYFTDLEQQNPEFKAQSQAQYQALDYSSEV